MSFRVINSSDFTDFQQLEVPPRCASKGPATETLGSTALSQRVRSSIDPSLLGREIDHIERVSALSLSLEELLELRSARQRRAEAIRNFNDLTCMMGALIVTAFFGIGYLLLNSKKV
jgi:hypothetical protein